MTEEEQISTGQFITRALAEKISAPTTDEYLKERAQHGSRETFERALAQVSGVEPEERDRLEP